MFELQEGEVISAPAMALELHSPSGSSISQMRFSSHRWGGHFQEIHSRTVLSISLSASLFLRLAERLVNLHYAQLRFQFSLELGGMGYFYWLKWKINSVNITLLCSVNLYPSLECSWSKSVHIHK